MSPAFSIVNRRGPSLPCKSLNPLTGIREVPVVNCNNRDFFSESQDRMAYPKSTSIAKSPEGLQLGVQAENYLPEPLYYIVTLRIPSIIRMLLPIIHIHLRNPTDQQLKFPLIKHINQILRNQLVEARSEILELFFDAFLNPPVCH
jgi:hypothetical protein